MLLDVDAIDAGYGDFQALYSLTTRVDEGETLAIVGANGAGKSTLMKAIVGLIRPTSGTISFEGRDLAAVPVHRRVAEGISLTPEGRRIFASLTVEENLLVGAYGRRPGPWDLARVYATFPLLHERRDRIGTNLSGGEQQMTAIARSLMSNPRLLLLDEVSLGLAPVIVEQIYDALPAITGEGTTVLVVEQDVNQALRVADRVQCLLEGRSVLEGTPAQIDRDQLAQAYFGL